MRAEIYTQLVLLFPFETTTFIDMYITTCIEHSSGYEKCVVWGNTEGRILKYIGL
jgi:hypothetical protein